MAKKFSVKRTCLSCNSVFYAEKYRVKKGLSVFCSLSCWHSSRTVPKGEKSNFWKGEKVGYSGIHKWLKKNFGKATHCESSACTHPRAKKFYWAKLKGKEYERKRENFWMLCCSCHRKYDMTPESIENNSKAQIGKTVSEATKQKLSESLKGRVFSEEHRKRISKSALGNKNAKKGGQSEANLLESP